MALKSITKNKLLLLVFFSVVVLSCMKLKNTFTPVVITEDPQASAAKAKEIRDKTPIKIADGLQINLWASDTLAPDPVSMSIDDLGRIYLTRTNRQKNSEFDIRGHRNWMTPSIALQSVEDRRKFLRETFAPEKSAENEWLKDLNEDGSHDWKDLAVEKDEIWRLEDKNGDGRADVSTMIFSDFNQEVTDVAGGILVRENDIFLNIAPDMWRLQDTNGDGFPDKKTSISTGWAVHIGFSGHGMSGATEGPDGRIYWQIGDIGANITTKEGVNHNYANEGILVRSNPDGSDFEVFASGIRNTHEFVFDEYGNIISSDNDGDHPGESERLVHIVEGYDSGWRSNWQYGKYTDPKNNKYKVWMDEKLYQPRWEGQAAYIIPPIMNYHNGPTGMVYNPGTALGKDWLRKFFLVEFVGSPSRSHIWSFGLKPKGASFALDGEKDLVSGILPTGIKFGPDGALYAADWVNGWGTKNYGRVWKIDVAEGKNDLEAVRKETNRLMKLKYPLQTEVMLSTLLKYEDMRIRQKAQLELAKRGKKGFETLKENIAQRENQLARIHGVWGVAQLSRADKSYAPVLIDLLKDADAEIVAQAAKALGDAKIATAGEQLIPLLKSQNFRVKFYAAEALGRIKQQNAVQPLLDMIEKNNDEDVYIRHAGVIALYKIGQVEPVVALASSPSKALRTAAVLVLRRLKNEQIAKFLQDKDEYIVTEAARAINDDHSIPAALPALAEVLSEKRFKSEPLLRRAINAALRVGGEKELDLTIAFAKRSDISDDLRAEALATIGTWAEPSVLDRVDGRYRGVVVRDLAMVKNKMAPNISNFLNDKNSATLIAFAQMLGSLKIDNHNEALAQIFKDSKDEKVRSAVLTALSDLKYSGIEPIIKAGMEDKDADVRTTALGLLGQLDISASALPAIVKPIFEKGTIREQQKMISVLGQMPIQKTEPVLSGLIDQLKDQKLAKELSLDLSEAIEVSKSERLAEKMKTVNPVTNILDEYKGALFGGNGFEGRRYFNTNSTGQCVRCHSINNVGGAVGPSLTKIGATLSRETILQALIEPSARLSPGFGVVTVTLKDGQEITGTLASESESELIINTSDAEPMKIAVSRIAKRENMPSSMPPMGSIMSKREIRDMVEFLSNLK